MKQYYRLFRRPEKNMLWQYTMGQYIDAHQNHDVYNQIINDLFNEYFSDYIQNDSITEIIICLNYNVRTNERYITGFEDCNRKNHDVNNSMIKELLTDMSCILANDYNSVKNLERWGLFL